MRFPRGVFSLLYCFNSSSLLPFLLLFPLIFCLLQTCDSFPAPGVFGLLQLNDRIRPPPISSYAKLPFDEPWVFVVPTHRFNDRTHLWHKRAMMRLGKRALMRLG
ncbi:hypothetical protein niasHS_007408 [Heterodera schachtii]|uniref:Secreted protein n=1 Tax=Heterodera schachtii TaxID=97005 RepID=A0ABD2JXE3_HETSC